MVTNSTFANNVATNFSLGATRHTPDPFVEHDHLLGGQDSSFEPGTRQLIPLLLLEGDHEPTAVVVEEAVDSRYVAVQRLGDYVPRVKAVIGAIILQDGSVAPVVGVRSEAKKTTTRAMS